MVSAPFTSYGFGNRSLTSGDGTATYCTLGSDRPQEGVALEHGEAKAMNEPPIPPATSSDAGCVPESVDIQVNAWDSPLTRRQV